MCNSHRLFTSPLTPA
jgi:choline transport protein